jgi:hypothetical protein
LSATRQAGSFKQDAPPDAAPDDSSDSSNPSPELLSALSGLDANRQRNVANRTRRVVMSSQGVMREAKKGGSRARAFAVAAAIVLLLLIAPLIWRVADNLIEGEHLGDMTSQSALWFCIFCPTILAAALVAGWWKNRF